MFRVIPDLISAVQHVVPPWALPLLAVAVVAALTPAYVYWFRSKQLKGLLRRYGRALDDAERMALGDAAFAMAERSPRLVVALADEAARLGYKPLVDRCLSWLAETGAAPADLARLNGKLRREKPAPMHPVEEVVFVERMMGQGMLVPARDRLDRALDRFPDDPDLREADVRLREAERTGPAQAR